MRIKDAENLTEHGNNAAIQVHVLPEDKMREIGFTDCVSERWYYCKGIGGKYGISFNLTINKDGSDWMLDVLDEDFLQPYDYQYMLDKNPKSEFPRMILEKVEEQMDYLIENGVISGHERYDYI